MHRAVKAALPTASGSLARVLAVFLDIRGFSSFFREVEAPEVAAYLRCLFQRILDNYFVSPDFFKLTGDGMMLILEYPEFPVERLRQLTNETVRTALRLVEDFPQLCSDDPNVYFEARPSGLGVGVARGSSYRLDSNGSILDYSGRPLNLAQRLMELARPDGVVLEHSVAANLEADLAQQFASANVYVRGGYEDTPLRVYYVKARTSIPPNNTRPLDKRNWQRVVSKTTWGEVKGWEPLYRIDLPSAPRNPDEITVSVEFPKKIPTWKQGKRGYVFQGFTHLQVGKDHLIELRVSELVSTLNKEKLTRKWPLRIQIDYEE
jgi:class 3 adenylate cyclase